MSDRGREPEAPHGGERHEPHGLVEEIRHEIEEVVEHVPPPVRWTVARVAWIAGATVAALLAVVAVSAALWIANRTEWVAQEAALLLNQALAARSDVALDLADVSGNPLTGIRFAEPRLRFRDGDGPPLLEARSLTARYGLWSLLTGGRGPIHVEIEGPVVRLAPGRDGRLRLPRWSGGARRGAARTLDVRLVLRDARLEAPAPLVARRVALDAELSTGATTRVRVRRLSWAEGPWGSALRRCEARVEAGDSVRVRVDALESADLALSGSAAWAARGGPREAEVEIRRVRWAWLARVFRNDAFDVPGEGALRARAAGERAWRGAFEARATWNGLPITGRGRFAYDAPRWRVSGLSAAGPAGELSEGVFDYRPDGWSFESRVRGGNPEHWGAIRLPGWPRGDLAGRFRYEVDTRRRDGRLRAWLAASELGGWRADSARVRADFPPGAPDSFVVEMERRGGAVRLAGATTEGGWSGAWSVTGLPLDEWPDGRASGLRGTLAHGAGTVEGRDGALAVRGALEGADTDWLGARMARWRLPSVEGRLLPAPDLALDGRLEAVEFLGLRFDSTALALRVGDAAARLETVRAWASDTAIAVSGEARWGPRGWRLELSGAEAVSEQFHWIADPPLALAGDATGVTFERLVARDGDATLAVRGRWAGPGGRYDWSAEGERLDLGRLGLPPAWRLAGRADAVLRVTGAAGDPRWSFAGRASAPGFQDHLADSLALDLHGAPGRLEVRRLLYALDGGRLSGEGEVRGTAAPWPASVTAEGVVAWLAGAAAWQGALRADDLPLDRLGRVTPAAAGWRGRVTGALRLGGRPAAPEAELEATARGLGWREYAADDVRARAAYRDGRLAVEDLRMTRGDLESTVRGHLPVRLALGAAPELTEAPMSFDARVPNGDLAVLSSFVPQVGYAAGRFDLDARVRGTPGAPKLDGAIRVRDGTVRPAAREELLEGVYADLRLDESRVTLDSLRARQGARGVVTGRGVVDIGGLRLRGYRFDLALRSFTASEAGLYAAEFDGDFVVTDGVRRHGQTLPMVSGEARVRRAAILIDFASQTEAQQLAATTQPLFWTYQVRVLANDQLRWQPPDADIEFNADLSIEQTTDSLLIYGEMRALRGTYWFLSNRFQVTRADLVFDNLNGVNPLVDAEATTRVTPSAARALDLAESTPVPHTVTVTISGRAREPQVEFASDPADMDESSILRALTVGSVYDERAGQVRLQDPLDSYLTKAINRTLSAELSKTFNNYLNDWQLERERGGLLAGQGGLVVSVSTQPWRNVNVRYRQRLPGAGRGADPGDASLLNPFERSVEAEYRLNRFFYVTTELTQRRTAAGGSATGSATPDFNVNLKARWEY
uniref:Translocation and assembly module TamB C-terminal domain-containing protein n=1 Tax=Eiseniibacteriota bacterium TaxID=2212470 RepID=A0A832I466_UNCEI